VHFGITMVPADFAVSPVRLGLLVEELGFESIWFGEHSHIPVRRATPFPSGTWVDRPGSSRGAGEVPDEFRHFHDCVVSLACIGAATQRLTLGMGTLVLPDHDPIALAKQISTLDQLCGGRVLVGVGAGWNLEEIANHGTDPRYRVSVMCERLEAMKAIWTHDEASYHGRFVNFDPIWQWPKPSQRPYPPVLLGGQGPTALERVVAHADGWLASGRHFDPVRLAEWAARLRELADRAGRAPVPVSYQDGPRTVSCIESCLGMGLERLIFRVPAAGEAEVRDSLEELVALVAPYRS
jgi:probable F420-dependent oxidoreductase